MTVNARKYFSKKFVPLPSQSIISTILNIPSIIDIESQSMGFEKDYQLTFDIAILGLTSRRVELN
jgi:hypothetical protein